MKPRADRRAVETSWRRRAAGFTILETFVALAILAVGALGAIAAINHSNIELRRGQLFLAQTALADQAIQSARLRLKASLLPEHPLSPLPDTVAIGAAPWAPDQGPDGAYFWIDGTGVVRPATVPSEVAAGTPCDKVPAGMFCREFVWTNGALADAKTIENASPITLWVRVSRQGDPLQNAVVQREVFLK